MLWDIFCKVIDNHGDIGVCWRLACNLADRGEQVRLWFGASAPGPGQADSGLPELAWMAPGGHPGVQVGRWQADSSFPAPGDVVVEAFGCELPPAVVAAMAARKDGPPRWINLEYLTAEGFAERNHRLRSPVLHGPGAGLTKHFFYPGFTPGTGGVLREPDLLQRQASFDRDAWLRALGIEAGGARLVSLFCYEPPALAQLFERLEHGPEPTRLLVTAGRATAAVKALFQREKTAGSSPRAYSLLSISYLPLLTQRDYDHLLWACDMNFVRGEDSLVRALWAGRPLAWQIYPQHDDAHHAKLRAWLDWMQAPASQREFHAGWNGITAALPAIDPLAWRATAQAARERLLAQDDLATQLLAFVRDGPP